MKRVGTVVGVAQGVAVLRAEDAAEQRIGTVVLDEHLETVGRVVDVFGPVDRPYLAVSPEAGADPSLVGSILYARS